jgi:hypothetical protein
MLATYFLQILIHFHGASFYSTAGNLSRLNCLPIWGRFEAERSPGRGDLRSFIGTGQETSHQQEGNSRKGGGKMVARSMVNSGDIPSVYQMQSLEKSENLISDE